MLDQLKQVMPAEILGSGKNISRHVGGAEFRAKSLFSFFSSPLFFLFFFHFFFPLRLVFLVIVVLFCFFI